MVIAAVSLGLIGMYAPVQEPTPAQAKIPSIAIFPWAYAENEKGTSEGGITTAKNLLRALCEEQAGWIIIPEAQSRRVWNETAETPWQDTYEDPADLAQLPKPSELLAFGKAAGADYVFAGRLRWHVKSIWVGLGPKTKAAATVDCMIVDVSKEEVALDVKAFDSGSVKAERWYETAGALLLTWGITLFSGGPKTPHIQKAGVKAIGGATEPFFTSYAKQGRKIK